MAAYRSTSENYIKHYDGGAYGASERNVAYAYAGRNDKSLNSRQAKGTAKRENSGKETKDKALHKGEAAKQQHNAAVRQGKTNKHQSGRKSGNTAVAAASGLRPKAHTNQAANAHKQRARQQVEREINNTAVPETGARKGYFYDTSLLCTVIFVFALGCLIIYSSSQYTAALERNGNSAYYFKRQLVIGGAGLIAAVIISLVVNYHWLDKFNAIAVKISYWGSIVLLMYTLVKGVASHGKSRWINILGIQFQPAEVAKIGLIIWIAWFISKKGKNLRKRENVMTVVAHAALPFVLILKQNISSAIIVALIAAVMLFVALENKKIFAFLGLGALGGMAAIKFAIQFYIQQTGYSTRSTHYWMRRILGWAAPKTFPDDAYQTLQSLYAIGSGGITGHGLGESIQKFGKLPEAQNDMIFAIVCEEFGFIGAATLILLFIYLIYRIYQVARNANDMFGTMLCTGVMAHLGIQAVLNIAVVTGAIPNTGVTLPFISYGGSAVFFTMCEIGLVLSVAHKIPRR